MKYMLVLTALFLTACPSIRMAMEPEVPKAQADLHASILQLESETLSFLETRVKDVRLVADGDSNKLLTNTQKIKRDLNQFADWLRNTGIQGKVLDATITRLQVWEDLEVFFVVQDDAYFKERIPLDQETRANVLDYLAWIRKIGKMTAEWIEEKGVIDG